MEKFQIQLNGSLGHGLEVGSGRVIHIDYIVDCKFVNYKS